MNKQVTEAFDALADRYEKETDGIRPYNAYYERPAMMAMLPDDLSGMDVLDAGCAAGWYSEQLLRLGARVTAVDASPRMVEAAKRRLGDRVDVRLHNLEDPLPFEAEQFDWIVCSLSLHYLLDWAPVLSEFARVLKPGGRLLFSTHHPFMDYMQFDQTDYFGVTLLRDQWTAGDRKVEVPFYRRPIGRIFTDILQWFDVEQVVEPQPVEELKRVDLAVYERLMTQPAFLIIQGRKKADSGKGTERNKQNRKEEGKLNLQIRPALLRDAGAIARIYNAGIRSGNATFETRTVTVEERRRWIEQQGEHHPVLVAETDGQVVGWASVHPYRERDCYRGVGEFSIYVDENHQGKGIGKQLLQALVEACARRGYWKLVSRIFHFNHASRALCQACGFREVGVYEKHGKRNGQWVDCVIVERLIGENLG